MLTRYQPFRILSGLLLLIITSLPAHTDPGQESGVNSPEKAYSYLKKAVENARSQEGFHLSVEFYLDASDRDDTMEVLSRGVFRKPLFVLESITPSGMQVTSYGNDRAIAHIDPSTDEVVTSKKLGIASVNRKMLDPFKHFEYLLKPDYKGFKCSFDGTKKINGSPQKIVKVQPGTDQIREVMQKFQDQLKRKIKPKKTKAVYRIFINKKQNVIRRVKLQVESEAKKNRQKQAKNEDNQNSTKQNNDEGSSNLPENVKQKLDEESKQENNQQNEEAQNSTNQPVSIKINGTFNLTQYNKNLTFTIPEDVQTKLKKWAKRSPDTSK